MNHIQKKPLHQLGYQFIESEYLPKDQNEYYLRDQQRGNTLQYRKLKASEIECLVRNDNTSDDWNNILVDNQFDPNLVQHCHFFGMVRIGKLEPYYLEFNNLRLPVGLYNSTIASCDFGDNVVVHHVNFLSHYIVGNEVIIANVNEMCVTDHAKFGNGILKDGESESVRIWLELCNENGGRRVLPFDGMLPGDAYLWTRSRQDKLLQERFKQMTEQVCDHRRGYYGMIGDRTVIKNCRILKDVWIGTDAYIKGANKIKNVTIHSSADAHTQIGEGCELVNGIVSLGCRIFYGVKAVRFVMASHSQLKYGARLINSYLGNNATISCCEVLNSLIFPAHEQHHNNSFLCAALIMGQSNMAAGATVGSNHNSRGADGEIIAGRGFWPGLCVSLKHTSRFASFVLISKGSYMYELDITHPFSLVAHEEHQNALMIMPGYFFLYNMYALARNAHKYVDRDKRLDQTQRIEYDYLAPDTIQEMIQSMQQMEYCVGQTAISMEGNPESKDPIVLGRAILRENPDRIRHWTILDPRQENSHRKVRLVKVDKAYPLFVSLIRLYAVEQILSSFERAELTCFEDLQALIAAELKQIHQPLENWMNVGGQLCTESQIQGLRDQIRNLSIASWDAVHEQYRVLGTAYDREKCLHAIQAYLRILYFPEKGDADFSWGHFQQEVASSIQLKWWLQDQIVLSRKKDYDNPFRKMAFEDEAEMDAVLGTLDENSFLQIAKQQGQTFEHKLNQLLQQWQKTLSS
jgi:hypothetical protein